jgi:hypothetical protein
MIVTTQFNGAVANELAHYKTLSDAAIRRAIHRAGIRATKWARSEVSRATRKQVKLPAATLRARIRAYTQSASNTLRMHKVWVGANAINVGLVGRARQTKAGVNVGGNSYPGAFVVGKRAGRVYERTGPERFPVRGVMLDLDDAAARAVRQTFQLLRQQFLSIMRAELKFEFLKMQGDLKR